MTEDQLKELDAILAASESKWGLQLTYPSWQDVAQTVRSHIWRKFHLFNPDKGKFSTWAKKVISNQIVNLKRRHYLRYVPPQKHCEQCERTGKDKCTHQNDWNHNKQQASNIYFALSLNVCHDDNEEMEKIQVAGDLVDMKDAILRFHEIMLASLDERLGQFYQLRYIEEKTDKEIAKAFGFITNEENRTPGYRQLYNMASEVRNLARFVLATSDIF